MTADWIQQIDGGITLAINSLHFESGDYLWQLFSLKEAWYPLYALVVFYTFRRLGWKNGGIMVVAMVLTIVACDQFANLIKDGVGRLRPCYNEALISKGLHILEGRGSFFGFFSAHAANAFGFAMSSTISFKTDKSHRYVKYQWFIFIWAAMVGISRVFAGKHFFGDVMTGTCVGLIFGWAIAKAGVWLTDKV